MTTALWTSHPLVRRLNLFSLRRNHPSGPAAYVFTLTVTALAALTSLALIPAIYQTPFLLFAASVLAALWFGGFRQSLVAIFISALFVNYYLLPPHGRLSLSGPSLARTGFWIVVAVSLSALVSQLRRAEDRSRRILASITEGFVILDHSWKIVYANPTAAQFFGKSRSEMIGQTFWEAFPEVQQRSVEQRLRWGVDTDQPAEFETQSQSPAKWAHMRAYAFPDGATVFIQDITAAKQKEDELRSALERFHIAQKAAQMGTWDWNIKTNDLIWSDEIPRIHGLRPEEFDGRLETWLKTIHPDDLPGVQAKIQKALETQDEYYAEFRVTWPNGETRWICGHGRVIVNAKGIPVRMVGIGADITAQHREEEAVRRSEKLATVSRLVATMAHEINNPLEAVTNLIYLMRQDKALCPETQQLLQMTDEQLARVNHLARQTLGFDRDHSTPTVIDVSGIMEELLRIFGPRLASKQIHVEKDFESPGTVAAFKGELQQLFSNLLANAIDASSTGGRLILRIRTELHVGPHPVRNVRADVEDFGPGIPAAARPHLFEPFFTTKAKIGTGLGLWLSKQIVEKNGGNIEFRTRSEGKDMGTCFSVTLPAPMPATPQLPARIANLAHQAETDRQAAAR